MRLGVVVLEILRQLCYCLFGFLCIFYWALLRPGLSSKHNHITFYVQSYKSGRFERFLLGRARGLIPVQRAYCNFYSVDTHFVGRPYLIELTKLFNNNDFFQWKVWASFGEFVDSCWSYGFAQKFSLFYSSRKSVNNKTSERYNSIQIQHRTDPYRPRVAQVRFSNSGKNCSDVIS